MVQDDRYSRDARREPPEETRRSIVGVDDVVALSPHQTYQLHERPRVLSRYDLSRDGDRLDDVQASHLFQSSHGVGIRPHDIDPTALGQQVLAPLLEEVAPSPVGMTTDHLERPNKHWEQESGGATAPLGSAIGQSDSRDSTASAQRPDAVGP